MNKKWLIALLLLTGGASSKLDAWWGGWGWGWPGWGYGWGWPGWGWGGAPLYSGRTIDAMDRARAAEIRAARAEGRLQALREMQQKAKEPKNK